MKKELKALIEAIGNDYSAWASRAFEANYSKINDFRDSIEVKEGSKYIKITHGNTVWGFVNKGNPDFEVGDILKAKNWRAPSLNKARGNVLNCYRVGAREQYCHGYLSGYSAGGTREGCLV